MFSVEIKVNTNLIVHIYGHNEGYTEKSDTCLYTYRIYDISKGSAIKGELEHIRSEGMLKLLNLITNDALKKE